MAEVYRRNTPYTRHHFVIKIEQDIADHDHGLADSPAAYPGDPPSIDFDFIPVAYTGMQAQLSQGGDRCAKKPGIHLVNPERQAFVMEDTLVKLLIFVEIGGAATHTPPDDGQTCNVAGSPVEYSTQGLMIADTNIGFLGARQDEGVGGILCHQLCQSMIKRLGANPGNCAQHQQSDRFVHRGFLSA